MGTRCSHLEVRQSPFDVHRLAREEVMGGES